MYNVYFLCGHMKFNLVRHFICLKTKMTEFTVGCFRINFFRNRLRRHTLKVLNIVQVVNVYITQSKLIVSFFGDEITVK